jgi:hypothetical protein
VLNKEQMFNKKITMDDINFTLKQQYTREIECIYNDYNEDDNESMVNNYQRVERVKNSLDSIYDEIQTPLLLSILYFLFQLPIVRKTLGKYIPLLCSNDGNYNINGLIFTCALFGFIYFMLSKTMKMGSL